MNRFGRQHHHSSVYKSFLAWKLELQILLKRNKRFFLYLVANLTTKLNSPHKLLPIIISLRTLRAEAMNPTQIVLRDVVETSPFFESLGGKNPPWRSIARPNVRCWPWFLCLGGQETFQRVAAVLFFLGATYKLWKKVHSKVSKKENTLVKWNLGWWRTVIMWHCEPMNDLF